MRLDQLMADHQYARKDIKQLLARRQILVDHLPAQKLSQNIDPGLQQIQIGDQIIQEPRHHYYMLHKPIGAVTAKRDAHHPTVIDLVDPQQEYPDLYPLGRLDRDTSGLLLLTDNGPLGFQLLHPQYHVEKVYEVEVNGPLYAAHIEQFQNGISFTDGPICKPASLTILESTPSYSKAQVRISEGKYHQVKKMFLAIGVKVISLKRLSFGPFTLDPQLAPGESRPLNDVELTWVKDYLEKRDKKALTTHFVQLELFFIRRLFSLSHSKNQDHKTRHKCLYNLFLEKESRIGYSRTTAIFIEQNWFVFAQGCKTQFQLS